MTDHDHRPLLLGWPLVAWVVMAALMVVIVAASAGCGRSERNTGTEKRTGPTSSISHPHALYDAHVLASLAPGRSVSAIAPTGSMEPCIDSRSVVVFEHCDGSDIQVGQVVRWDHEGETIMHRVAAINSTHFIPSGISNPTSDGWVARNRVTGRLYATFYTGP